MHLHAAHSNRPEIERNATAHNSNSPDCQPNPNQPKWIDPAKYMHIKPKPHIDQK